MTKNLKLYATMLYEICQEKNEKDLKTTVKDFFNLLVKNNLISKIDNIILEFEEIWNKREGVLKAVVISAYELSPRDLSETELYLKKKTSAKKIIIQNIIDQKIRGGLIIKYQDKVIDSSLLCELNNFQKELIN